VYTNEQEIEDFLQEYGRSRVIIETTTRATLNRAVEFEHKFNKPFYDFATEEALEMYKSVHAISVVTLQNNNLVLKHAARWFAYKYNKEVANTYEEMTKDMLDTVVDVEKKASLILSKEDVEDIIEQLLNWTDKCLVFLLFNGVGGNLLKELTFMQWNQVSRQDLKIYFRNGKVIDITNQDYEMLKQGFEEDELISFGETNRVAKVRSLGLYKARCNSLSDNDNPEDKTDQERRYRWVQRRLILISKDLGIRLTSGGLQSSGLLYHLQQGVKETGLDFREFTKTKYAESLARRYDILSEEFYAQILLDKFSMYFE
jgi:hypothetical protein